MTYPSGSQFEALRRVGQRSMTGTDCQRIEDLQKLAAWRRCTNPFAESVARLLGLSHEL
jgi:hypothetical protein